MLNLDVRRERGRQPWTCLSEPATVQNPTAVHSGRDDFLKVSLWSRLQDPPPPEGHLSDCFLSVALRCTGVMPPATWTVTWF